MRYKNIELLCLHTMRHRQLLQQTTFDDRDDIHFLVEAAEYGDIEVLRHVINLRVNIPSSALDKAVLNNHINCVELLANYSSNTRWLQIGSHATEELIRQGKTEMLEFLLRNNLVSQSGLYVLSLNDQ